MIGTSGSTAERVVVVTASARSLPERTGSIEADIGSNIISALPSTIAFSAGPPPG